MPSTHGRYTKRPIAIEAFHFDPDTAEGAAEDFVQLKNWANNLVREQLDADTTRYFVFDRLHDTWVEFWAGDWIVKGVQGEFYAVKADVFEATYEPVKKVNVRVSTTTGVSYSPYLTSFR